MKLKHVTVELVPSYYQERDNNYAIIKISIKTDEEDFKREQPFNVNDFDSAFEKIMRLATEEIKTFMRKPEPTGFYNV